MVRHFCELVKTPLTCWDQVELAAVSIFATYNSVLGFWYLVGWLVNGYYEPVLTLNMWGIVDCLKHVSPSLL